MFRRLTRQLRAVRCALARTLDRDVSVGLRVVAVIAGIVVTALAALLAVVWWSANSSPSAVTVTGSLGKGTASTLQPVTFTPYPAPTAPATFSEHEAGTPDSFDVRTRDQSGDGRSVTVDEASLTGRSGWIVVHADDYGAPGQIIGVSNQISAGTTSNVSISLSQPISSSRYVIVMLHYEDNGDSTFDYPAADQPVVISGQIVDVRVWVRVG